jgi:hypothetical protein
MDWPMVLLRPQGSLQNEVEQEHGEHDCLKHAVASHAVLTLRYRAHGLQIDVVDDGAGAASSDGLGHGLVGIRERVKIYDGDMTAGAAPSGGFVLTAPLRCPWPGTAPRHDRARSRRRRPARAAARAIRVVARGDALLSPAVTKRVI